MKKQASSIVFGRLCLLAMLAPVLASAQGSYLKLPDDYSQSAIVYVDPGEKSNMSHLTQEEIIKLGEWLKVKSEKSKEGDVMITYREKADEGVPIYQPAGFKGQAKVGAVGEEMTDGRLTLKVAGVKRTIYASMGYGGYGSSSLPYEYVAACVLGNPGTADVKVKSLTYYFFEPDGNRARPWRGERSSRTAMFFRSRPKQKSTRPVPSRKPSSAHRGPVKCSTIFA